MLEANAIQLGDEVLCQVVAHSDWAPVLRCYLLLSRGDSLEFAPEADEPGLEIRRMQLAKGVGLIADVGEEQRGSATLRTAANG